MNARDASILMFVALGILSGLFAVGALEAVIMAFAYPMESGIVRVITLAAPFLFFLLLVWIAVHLIRFRTRYSEFLFPDPDTEAPQPRPQPGVLHLEGPQPVARRRDQNRGGQRHGQPGLAPQRLDHGRAIEEQVHLDPAAPARIGLPCEGVESRVIGERSREEGFPLTNFGDPPGDHGLLQDVARLGIDGVDRLPNRWPVLLQVSAQLAQRGEHACERRPHRRCRVRRAPGNRRYRGPVAPSLARISHQADIRGMKSLCYSISFESFAGNVLSQSVLFGFPPNLASHLGRFPLGHSYCSYVSL